MNSKDLSLFFILLIAMEGVVLGAVVEVIVAEAVLEARHDRLKVFDVIVFVLAKIWQSVLCNFTGIEKKIRNLFAKLWCDGDLCYAIDLAFVKGFSFSSLKEAQIWYLQSKINLEVDA